jgi:hypothetical protein
MSFQIQLFLMLKWFQSVAICTILFVLGASRIVYIAEIQEVEQVETGVGAFDWHKRGVMVLLHRAVMLQHFVYNKWCTLLQHTFLYVFNWPHFAWLVTFLHTISLLLTIPSTLLGLLCFLVQNLTLKNVCGLVVIDILYSVEPLIFSWICEISSDINIIRMMMLTLNRILRLKIKSSCLVYFTSNKYKNSSPFQHLQIKLKWLKTVILNKMEFSELLGSNGYKTH